MAYVIGSACIDVKDGACVKCCPVDCIYVGSKSRNNESIDATLMWPVRSPS